MTTPSPNLSLVNQNNQNDQLIDLIQRKLREIEIQGLDTCLNPQNLSNTQTRSCFMPAGPFLYGLP